ncbi:hypothetical protein B0T19DRAFT_483116 [Cercophora scortea]|uniref:Uncharacterized protein n=1 Tax=Cercophora scortea TaxID=314031 RepID=A0AAE0IXY9_9PEZI|nr:hypothetical protein B0T19DRAFT_483116 [Cercophora scortea]
MSASNQLSVQPAMEITASSPAPVLTAAWKWAQYGIRGLFVLTEAALLAVTGYIAARWGSIHIEKVYAVVIVGAIIAVLADCSSFVLLSIKPQVAPAAALLDVVVIILCAIGVPSIMSSGFQNTYDPVAWRLAVAVICERVLSIAICIGLVFVSWRKAAAEHRPRILNQREMAVNMKTRNVKLSTESSKACEKPEPASDHWHRIMTG